jgi:hypothetical protein
MHNSLAWFPFYTRDWFTDVKVRLMGPVARAYFLELLRTQWDEGSIPAPAPACEDCQSHQRDMCDKCRSAQLEPIRRLLQMPQDRCFDEMMDGLDYDGILRQVLTAFGPDGNGGLVNSKLKKVREEQEKIKASKSLGAQKANHKRWGSESDQTLIRHRSDSDNKAINPASIFDIKRQMVAIAAKKGMP